MLSEFLSWQEFLLCSGAVFIAAILQISTGMGFGMLASPLIALIKPELVPGVVLTIGLAVSSVGAISERKHISPAEIKNGILGRFIGCLIAFGILLVVPSVDYFLILFGALMLLAIFLTAVGYQMEFTLENLLRLSVVSGLMGTITAVGAPPMAIIYHNRDPRIVRPTLNLFFLSSCILGLVMLGFSGWLKLEAVTTAFLLLPALAVGIVSGNALRSWSGRFLSRTLLAISGLASAILILRGFGIF